MKRALIVGGSGLLGHALHQALAPTGAELLATHRHHAGSNTHPLDLTARGALRQLSDQFKPSVIFLAVNATGGVDACEQNPQEAQTLLVEATREALDAAKACGARVVYYSSDYVFDGQNGPYAETDTPRPVSAYGRAKLEGEALVKAAGAGHLIIRTTAVFGWNRTSPNFAMQLYQKLSAGQPMRVPSDQVCNPTLADYLAEVSLRLVESGTDGVVNVVGRDRMSRAEWAQALARTMALKTENLQSVPTSDLGQKAARPLQGGLKTGKLEKLLGTEAMPLDEALKRFRRQWRADTHTSYQKASASSPAQALKEEIFSKVRQYYDLVHKPKAFTPFQSRVQYAGRVFGEEEMVNLVDSSLDFWLTLGPYGDEFESKMKRYFGAADFMAVNSGSTANLAALMTLTAPQLEGGLRPGDEVLTPAVTFPTTLAPIVHQGLIPVFVDCELGTYNMNPALLEKAIGPKTRAIVAPHTLGNPCDLDVLKELAKKHHLFLMEDSCDALGGLFGGQKVGTFGDLATLSFYPAHHITMGEGGGVVINSPRLSRLARSVRDWGRSCWCAPGESNSCGTRFGWKLGGLPAGYDHKYTYSTLGYNFKPTDMQAAIGVAQLERLPTFVAQRRRNFDRLFSGLSKYQDHLVLPRWSPKAEPSWFGFPITVQPSVRRGELVQWLETANIETRQIFAGNILQQPGYQGIPHRLAGPLTNTDRVMRDAFFIGVYPGLSDGMIDFVLERFKTFFDGRPKARA